MQCFQEETTSQETPAISTGKSSMEHDRRKERKVVTLSQEKHLMRGVKTKR